MQCIELVLGTSIPFAGVRDKWIEEVFRVEYFEERGWGLAFGGSSLSGLRAPGLDGLRLGGLGGLGAIVTTPYKSKRVAHRNRRKAAAVICSSKLTRAFGMFPWSWDIVGHWRNKGRYLTAPTFPKYSDRVNTNTPIADARVMQVFHKRAR